MVQVNSEKAKKLMEWMFDNYILYGDPWIAWWKEEGEESFLKYMEKIMRETKE